VGRDHSALNQGIHVSVESVDLCFVTFDLPPSG